MGTPRLSKPVDQMRNVQRTASCGGEIALDRTRENERSRSTETKSGAGEVRVATHVALNSELFFASGCETGAWFLVEVAQQVLLAQQPGRQAFCAGASETMQVRAETWSGAVIRATAIAIEITALLNIGSYDTIG